MKVIIALIISMLTTESFAVDPRTAYTMVQKGEAILIDVREMKELREGMIDKAAWFPMSEMKPGSDILKDFKSITQDKKVFVYCQGGKRAEACKEILRKEGIDAESLGGFTELRHVLPTKSLYQRLNEPYSDTEASNSKRK